MELPDWVRKHKTKGTEVRHVNGRYYLYKIHSVRDPKKGRPRKITDKYLGKITPEGLMKPKYQRFVDDMKNISVKEYGASYFIIEQNKDIVKIIKKIYPEKWKEIVCFAVFRFLYNSPLKSLISDYSSSYISEEIKDALMSPKYMSNLLFDIGSKREKMVNFLKYFVEGNEHVIVDGTHIFSSSEGVDAAVPGYNSKRVFSPQVRLVLIHSLDKNMPAYFRFLSGSITDVSAVSLTVEEANIKNAVLIGDKGFYSKKNVEKLEDQKVKYILPLKRNSTLINYDTIASGDKRNLGGYFVFQKRAVWYCKYHTEGKTIITFLDEKLKAEEETCFIQLVEEEKRTMDTFYEKQMSRGTLSVITDLDAPSQRIYELLKARIEIEVAIDAFKNVLKADRTYMRNDKQMEGWMFINFVALLFYYKTYSLLSDKKLLSKYSPKDMMLHLSRVFKLKIGKNWVISEIPKKTRTIIEKLDISIT